MPLRDLVVDANVLVHASNEANAYCGPSRKLIALLLESDVCIRIDEGFDLDQAKNKSLIGSEYLRHLTTGSIGYALISSLAATMRLKPASKGMPLKLKRKLIELIEDNKRDRTYVLVAYNTDDKHLTSHDFTDFNEDIREIIQERFSVRILVAQDCVRTILT